MGRDKVSEVSTVARTQVERTFAQMPDAQIGVVATRFKHWNPIWFTVE
jgi:hypothetical protein